MRINQYIASCGICSRRKADFLIGEQRVSVNGEIVSTPGMQIEEKKDIVKVDGKRIFLEQEKVYYMINKPLKYLSTVTDDRNRRTVLHLIKEKQRIYPVGRLDYMSTGLLLLTNDGELANGLTHPKYHVKKTYFVKVIGREAKNIKEIFREGIFIGEYRTAPAEIECLRKKEDVFEYLVTIGEGKNRQVRRMFEAIGMKVTALKRISIGKLNVGNLKEGEYRSLTEEEIVYLKHIVPSAGRKGSAL